MPRRASVQPTEVELEILNVLWEHGPCPLGKIHEHVAARYDRAYSTTRKMLQVMRDKGLVTCDDSARPQLYQAARTREHTQLSLLEDIAKRAFGGSTKKIVMSLLSNERLTAEELAEMQRLITNANGKRQ